MSKHILLIGGSGAALMIGLTAGLPGTAAGAGPQACVSGHVSRCYASLAEALAHTVNGDVVSLAEGTYKGGVTITKSVRIRGAGEGATVIEGGGPVLTVKATSKFKPVVELVDLTVTGGVNTGLALSSKDTGIVGSGGGILVPYSNGKGGAGASLTLRRVAVIGNVARPSTTVSSPRGAQCPEGVCPYAGAYGGGIATAGPLTLDDATVSDNLAGGTASDAAGGGIYSAVGPVVIGGSTIAGNTAAPTPHTIGRYAEGGGLTIVENSQPTTITDTRIENNVAKLVTDWPVSVDMGAESGGVFMEGNTQLTMTGSVLSGNQVAADAPVGEPLVIDAALHYQHGGEGLRLVDTVIAGNSLVANIATAEDVAPMGGFVESGGHAVLESVTITGNTQSIHTTTGTAGLSGAVFLCGCGNGDGGIMNLTDVTVSDNLSTATSESGPAWVWGGGIFVLDGAHLTLASSRIADNHSIARALDGSGEAEVRGGGLWAGPLWGSDPTVDLTGSIVTGNAGTVSPGGTVLGGGVYAEVPVTGTAGVTGNVPDDVYLP